MDETTKQDGKLPGNAGKSAGKAEAGKAAAPAADSREARLAVALRQNLKRRKSAARQRADRDGSAATVSAEDADGGGGSPAG